MAGAGERSAGGSDGLRRILRPVGIVVLAVATVGVFSQPAGPRAVVAGAVTAWLVAAASIAPAPNLAFEPAWHGPRAVAASTVGPRHGPLPVGNRS